MKKIVLSIAAAVAATAMAPEASAVPAFARQTGMACSSCHQQAFPVLNGFGRAFKAAGYTMMGAQEKVEGEHLSLPGTLNASMLIKVRYQKNQGATLAVAGQNNVNNGQLQIPDEFALLLGGRVGENVGFLAEVGLAGANVLGGPVLGFKLPMSFDVGGAQVGVVPFLTDALGASYGFELASTGAVRNVRWAEHANEISAQSYIGTGAAATGITGFAKNDMGFANVTMFNGTFANGGAGAKMSSTYARLALTPTVGDWDMLVGVQSWSGHSNVQATAALGTVLAAGVDTDTKATALDFQAFGNVGGNDLSVYATHASAADNIGAVRANAFAGKATTIGANYSVIPHVLHIGAAYRNAKTGATALVAAQSDNATSLFAIYDLYQNVALHMNYSSYSNAAVNANGSSLMTLMLEAAW